LRSRGMDVKRCAGGSASNMAKALAQLRRMDNEPEESGFFGARGLDDLGRYFGEAMESKGVRTMGPVREGHTTGTCLCLVSRETGQRTMRTCNGASATVSASDWPPKEIDGGGVGHVHVEGYLFRDPGMMEKIFETMKSAGASTSVDLASFEMVRARRDAIRGVLDGRELVDILFCNEDEADAFVGPDGDKVEVLGPLAQIVVVSLGARGCMAIHEGKVTRAGAPDIRVVDTTGAGDFFTAGFLCSRLRGGSLEESCRVACLSGAAACLQLGTDISLEELKEFVSSGGGGEGGGGGD